MTITGQDIFNLAFAAYCLFSYCRLLSLKEEVHKAKIRGDVALELWQRVKDKNDGNT